LSQQPVITLKQTVAQPRSFVQSSRPTNIPPSPPPPPPPPPHIPPPQFSLPLPPPQPRRQTNMDYRSTLSPNEKLGLCCRKRNLPSSCQTLCNYDTFTDRSLVNAVLTNQCPGPQLTQAFDCATSMADHTECCIRNGIGTFNGGQCMAFCTTHRGNPNNAFQYIGCLQVFDRIKQCYSDYHINHPNIFGDF
uniref:DB domain-containing protein n=1 Tax=Dracunculus medinensis TaxID=318479 RepID=A0A0N4U2P1_DRAME